MLDWNNALRYIAFVLKRLSKIVALSTILLSPLGFSKSPKIRTHSHRPGHIVSDNPTMKAWLKKIPEAFRDIKARNKRVKITKIDVKWKQTNITRTIARTKRKSTTRSSYVCELHLTIKFEDSHGYEDVPSQTHYARPVRVKS